jgi:hypothetical protein
VTVIPPVGKVTRRRSTAEVLGRSRGAKTLWRIHKRTKKRQAKMAVRFVVVNDRAPPAARI